MDASISVAPAPREPVCGIVWRRGRPARGRLTHPPPGKPEDASNVSTCREGGALWNQCVRFCRDGTAKAGRAAWGSDANASHL